MYEIISQVFPNFGVRENHVVDLRYSLLKMGEGSGPAHQLSIGMRHFLNNSLQHPCQVGRAHNLPNRFQKSPAHGQYWIHLLRRRC